MRRHADQVASARFDGAVAPAIGRLLEVVGTCPAALLPGTELPAEAAFTSRGFRLRATGPRTTVCFDPATDCFLEILHARPRALRERAHALVSHRARWIHALAEGLIERGSASPASGPSARSAMAGSRSTRPTGFRAGPSTNSWSPHRRALPTALAGAVIDAVAGLHALGYWHGDLHLSHVFVLDGEVSGFIDLDGVRRNRPFLLDNLARDLAGLNHPALPAWPRAKASLLGRYAATMALQDESAFRRLVATRSAERWRRARRGSAAGPAAP